MFTSLWHNRENMMSKIRIHHKTLQLESIPSTLYLLRYGTYSRTWQQKI